MVIEKRMMHQGYITYSKQDFLNDTFFVKSVKFPNAYSEIFWKKYLALNPLNFQHYQDARLELLYILESVIRIKANKTDKFAVWENILNRIPVEQKRIVRMTLIRNVSIAATILLVLGGLIFFVYHSYYQQIYNYSTPYSRIREVILPDSSRIVLNANSKIKYAAHWKSDQPREIWLSGEAYFEVKHKNKDPKHIENNERFIVHTSKLDVQVLGTVFNVKARPGDNTVVLVSGKVAVRASGTKKWQLLSPGQSFKYLASTSEKIIKNVDPSILTAWKDRSVILPANTRLNDIIPQLEENYGVHIKLSSAEIGGKAIEGILPLTNQDNLFFILNHVLKIEISQKDSTWVFKPQIQK